MQGLKKKQQQQTDNGYHQSNRHTHFYFASFGWLTK